MNKKGRPTDDLKDKTIKIRINKEIDKKFEEYCRNNNTNKSELCRNYIYNLLKNN